MTESGRAALALAVKNYSMHLAWGTGLEEWGEEPPVPDINTTALVHEIGRVSAWRTLFVTPDNDGDLITMGKRYAVSIEPTRHLYAHFKFDFSDGVGSTIRELGVYLGTRAKSTVPPGQRYLQPEDLEHQGILYTIERRAPLVRRASDRYEAELVLSM